MPTPSSISLRDWLETFASRCPCLAADFSEADRDELAHRVRRLAVGVPAHLDVKERAAMLLLLSRVLPRLARLARINRRPEFANAFVDWAESNAHNASSSGFLGLIEQCAGAFQASDVDVRISRILESIRDRYAEQDLSLASATLGSPLSLWHSARLLKKQTRLTFREHLHVVRTEAARGLLDETTLTIKEIGFRVGYRSSSEFGKRFRRRIRMTPLTFRRRVR